MKPGTPCKQITQSGWIGIETFWLGPLRHSGDRNRFESRVNEQDKGRKGMGSGIEDFRRFGAVRGGSRISLLGSPEAEHQGKTPTYQRKANGSPSPANLIGRPILLTYSLA